MTSTDKSPTTFTVRPLTAEEAAQVAGGAGYLKIGDIKGEATGSQRIGLLPPAVQKAF